MVQKKNLIKMPSRDIVHFRAIPPPPLNTYCIVDMDYSLDLINARIAYCKRVWQRQCIPCLDVFAHVPRFSKVYLVEDV